MSQSALQRTLLGAALMVGLWASLAQAQPRNTALIRRQLETSLTLQIEAVNALDEAGRAERLTYDAYVQMRAAHGHMTINDSNAKYPDPLFPLANRRIEQARGRLLAAHEALKARTTSNASGNAIDIARNHLTEAIRMTRLILATTF